MKTPLILLEREPVSLTTNLPLRKGSDGYNTPQDYNIKGHLPSNTLASIYGPSGSYKSFLAVSWACHIATGKPWASRRVTQGFRRLYRRRRRYRRATAYPRVGNGI